MKTRSGFPIAMLACALGQASLAAETVGTNGPSRGDRRFGEPAPYSSVTEILRRSGYPVTALQYDLANEKFRVVVPELYSTNSAWGLLVWISPGNDAYMPSGWEAELARHRLLFIGPYNSGNNRHPVERMRLALDATCNMCRNYRIDRRRIYVGGFSGGGRIASILGVAYGDLYTGTLCICGVNFYREVRTTGGAHFPATYFPEPGALTQAKKNGRFALLTGETDMNRENTRCTAENGFRADGFRNVFYLEVVGMGHAIPGPGPLNTALKFLTADASTGGPGSTGSPAR